MFKMFLYMLFIVVLHATVPCFTVDFTATTESTTILHETTEANYDETHFNHAEAKAMLDHAGINIRSSGNCHDRTNRMCTSLDAIRKQTIRGIIAFKNACNCNITITGGTETGHAHGTFSHENGYKVDVSKKDGGPKLSDYIKHHFKLMANSHKKYEDPSGNTYYDENDLHWDITYKGKSDYQ